MSTTVIEMVRHHLRAYGFSGLKAEECGCELADLAPCGQIGEQCQAGYKHQRPGGDPNDWAIWLHPRPPTATQWEGVDTP